MYPESVNVNSFIVMFRNRLYDLFISKWRIDVNDASSLCLFRELKPIFERSLYLDKVENSKFRNILAKLRLSSHVLFIETGRHQNIPRNERICKFCTLNEIEDEYHFVLICPLYDNFRNTLIPVFYRRRPSMFKFLQLLNETKKSILIRLANFCTKAFKLRAENI